MHLGMQQAVLSRPLALKRRKLQTSKIKHLDSDFLQAEAKPQTTLLSFQRPTNSANIAFPTP